MAWSDAARAAAVEARRRHKTAKHFFLSPGTGKLKGLSTLSKIEKEKVSWMTKLHRSSFSTTKAARDVMTQRVLQMRKVK
jgi:hypothetical protein